MRYIATIMVDVDFVSGEDHPIAEKWIEGYQKHLKEKLTEAVHLTSLRTTQSIQLRSIEVGITGV
jgi:hypothetical protein